MPLAFADKTDDAIPLHVISADALDAALDRLPPPARNWVEAQGFSAALGEHVLIPNAEGQVSEGLIGFGTEATRARAISLGRCCQRPTEGHLSHCRRARRS